MKPGWRDNIIRINIDIIQNGGLIKYLNLDNIDYVNRKTENYNWNKNGIDIFME